MGDLAALKEASRQALHESLAVSASHDRDGALTPTPEQLAAGMKLTVRWHNRLDRTGGMTEGDFGAEIIEGINRLVFNSRQLAALDLELETGDVIRVPGLEASFVLDSSEPGDGPLNVYWNVVRR